MRKIDHSKREINLPQTLKKSHNYSFTTYVTRRVFRIGQNKIHITKLQPH